MCEKNCEEKHKKYIDYLNKINGGRTEGKELFWGMGIENESYIKAEKMDKVNTSFLMKNTKRERYSVDYYSNYNMEKFKKVVSSIKSAIIPYYINGYMFQKVDIYGEHKTLYTKGNECNIKYSGMSIHEYMMYTSKKYAELFDKEKKVLFDGDTIEFTTTNFYKTNVKRIIHELNETKNIFLSELNKYLANKFIFSGYGQIFNYPSYNHGFVKYLTNKNNLGICNSGTYHLNITLPCVILIDGMKIEDEKKFNSIHKTAIKYIQWIEPLLIGLYGTPDILSCISKDYCRGSLRIMMSRYIGLGTYDSDSMERGKKLNDFDYKENGKHYFNDLHKNKNIEEGINIYNPPDKIGYDINFNKFKNHGIELRIFDYFPEEYLEDILNFIILVCQHSIYNKNVKKPQNSEIWNKMAKLCMHEGSDTVITEEIYSNLIELFGINMNTFECNCCFSLFKKSENITIKKLLTDISDYLYEKYKDDDNIVKKMSPCMKKIVWTDYNKIIKYKYENSIELYKDI